VTADNDRCSAAQYTLHALEDRHTETVTGRSADLELAATCRTHGGLILTAERLADPVDFLW
jgi:hypothetical protein